MSVTAPLTTDNAREGLAIHCTAHPEWGLWTLRRYGNDGWLRRGAGGEVVLDSGEFSFWEVVPRCLADMRCLCALHARGGDPAHACDAREVVPPSRSRAALEREILDTMRALGALRGDWGTRKGKAAAQWTHKRDEIYARLESLSVDYAALAPPPADVAHVPLTHEQLRMLLDAVDSHVYERAPEHAHRNSGHVMDPRLDPDFDEDQDLLSDDDQQTADFLDAHDTVENVLRAYLPKETK